MMLFETMAIIDGQIANLNYHNQRFIKGQQLLNCPIIYPNLQNFINLPKTMLGQKLVRGRITYHRDFIDVQYFDYQPKNIQSFKMVICDDIDYAYKYHDRQPLNALLAQKDNCDEIIIVKQGMITDCSIGNLLFLKRGIWYTPNTPLLAGTQRQYLLDKQKIYLADINIDNIFDYEKVMMINALNAFDESWAIAVSCIF